MLNANGQPPSAAFMSPSQSKIEARRFLVRGRVQGVGFRWFVEREAHILGVAGWVRNNADGAVEVFAQGTAEQLRNLRARLHEGPRAARVDQVEEAEAPLSQGAKTFRIEGAW
jgi:acylphosphatase